MGAVVDNVDPCRMPGCRLRLRLHNTHGSLRLFFFLVSPSFDTNRFFLSSSESVSCPRNQASSSLVSTYICLRLNILISGAHLGGLNTCSRALASYLVPLNGEALVSVRLYSLPLSRSSERAINPSAAFADHRQVLCCTSHYVRLPIAFR